MNRILKIGLIGFWSIFAITVILRVTANIEPGYIMPLALPFGMAIIMGALKKK